MQVTWRVSEEILFNGKFIKIQVNEIFFKGVRTHLVIKRIFLKKYFVLIFKIISTSANLSMNRKLNKYRKKSNNKLQSATFYCAPTSHHYSCQLITFLSLHFSLNDLTTKQFNAKSTSNKNASRKNRKDSTKKFFKDKIFF